MSDSGSGGAGPRRFWFRTSFPLRREFVERDQGPFGVSPTECEERALGWTLVIRSQFAPRSQPSQLGSQVLLR